jgi:hypothetical protein
MHIRKLSLALALLAIFAVPAPAQQPPGPVDPSLYSAMRWRLIGPHRAGRVTGVAGIPGDPTTYYMATPGGGVWKTTDAGEVWFPIFDDQHVSSIGALAIAPSNSKIIYVGTGEQPAGDGGDASCAVRSDQAPAHGGIEAGVDWAGRLLSGSDERGCDNCEDCEC